MLTTLPDFPGLIFDGFELRKPTYAEQCAVAGWTAAPLPSSRTSTEMLPGAAKDATVNDELAKLPASVLRYLRSRGVRIEVIPGNNAGLHPAATFACRGFCYGNLIVIAAACAVDATLHECGHAFDDVRVRGGRFSSLPEWKRIHAQLDDEVFARDRLGIDHRSNPQESFAECFGKYFHNATNLAELPAAARRFIQDRTT